jgi:hypothetical protein
MVCCEPSATPGECLTARESSPPAQVWGQTGAKLYGSKSGADYIDNQKRFKLFCEAAIESLRVLPFGPGEDCLIVANDWHSALVPVLIKDVYQPRGEFKDTKVCGDGHSSGLGCRRGLVCWQRHGQGWASRGWLEGAQMRGWVTAGEVGTDSIWWGREARRQQLCMGNARES